MLKNKLNRWFAHVFFVTTGCMAAGSVWAVVLPPPELLGLPWVQIFVAGLISLWGGVGRTAVRAIEDAQERRDKPGVATGFHLKSELIKDFFVSSGLGFFVYVLGTHQAWDQWLLAPSLWLAGYMGTKLIAGLSTAVLQQLNNLTRKDD